MPPAHLPATTVWAILAALKQAYRCCDAATLARSMSGPRSSRLHTHKEEAATARRRIKASPLNCGQDRLLALTIEATQIACRVQKPRQRPLQSTCAIRAVSAAEHGELRSGSQRLSLLTRFTGHYTGTVAGRCCALQQYQRCYELVLFTAHELFYAEIVTSQPRQRIELERG